MVTHKRRWNAKEDIIIRRGVSVGFTHKEIADQLQRTIPAVSQRIKKLGLQNEKREWLTVEDEKLIELSGQGVEHKKIARLLNRSPNAVKYRVHQLKEKMC